MQLLTREDVAVITDELVADLPRRLLLQIARQSGQGERQLATDLARSLPSSVPAITLRDWVVAMLDWFVSRGDIERGLGGRYACVPPYLIGETSNEHPFSLWLCGDPHADYHLRLHLASLGATIVEQVVSSEPESGITATTDGPALLGLQRLLLARAGMCRPIEDCLAQRGITIIRPDALAVALPTLDLLVPPAHNPAPPLIGLWQRYDPSAPGDARWLDVPDWASGTARLVRWLPSDDWQGERAARVFFHAGGGHVAELGPEAAALWQLRLDADAQRPRTIWRDGTRLWAPGMLPPATHQWLRVLAGPASGSRFRRGWLVLPLTDATIERACTKLIAAYHLRSQEGQPPFVPYPTPPRRRS